MKIEISNCTNFLKEFFTEKRKLLFFVLGLVIFLIFIILLNNNNRYFKFFYFDNKGKIAYNYKEVNIKNKKKDRIILNVLNEEILGSNNILLKDTFNLSGKIYNVIIQNNKLIINCNKDFVNDYNFEKNLVLLQITLFQNFKFIMEVEIYIENEYYREINRKTINKNEIFKFFLWNINF